MRDGAGRPNMHTKDKEQGQGQGKLCLDQRQVGIAQNKEGLSPETIVV